MSERRWFFHTTMLHGNQPGVMVFYDNIEEAVAAGVERLTRVWNNDHYYTGFRIDHLQETEDGCLPPLPFEES